MKKNMKIVSVHVGMPKNLPWKGKDVFTGIFKDEVKGAVRVNRYHLDGDGQGDKKHHGGEFKALYSYEGEHYDYWETTLGFRPTPAMFGENVITQGLSEADMCVGDVFRFGTVVLEAAEPRFPCSRLGLRFSDDSIIKKFMDSGRLGIYYKVRETGEIKAGDTIELLEKNTEGLKIYDIGDAKRNRGDTAAIIDKILAHSLVNPTWKEWAREKLERQT